MAIQHDTHPQTPDTALAPTTGVMVITTEDGDDSAVNANLAAARRVAAGAASSAGVPVVLYDRSGETWGDSQHPEGPLAKDAGLVKQRPHLGPQMDEVAAAGVEVRAWLSTLPTISAVITALTEVDADVVIVPQKLERKLLEKMLVGDSVASALRTQLERQPHCNVRVVEISPDGDVLFEGTA